MPVGGPYLIEGILEAADVNHEVKDVLSHKLWYGSEGGGRLIWQGESNGLEGGPFLVYGNMGQVAGCSHQEVESQLQQLGLIQCCFRAQ